jgi:hypothetical protein
VFVCFEGQSPLESLDNIENELMRSRLVNDELELVEQALVDDLFDDTLTRHDDANDTNSSTFEMNTRSLQYHSNIYMASFKNSRPLVALFL